MRQFCWLVVESRRKAWSVKANYTQRCHVLSVGVSRLFQASCKLYNQNVYRQSGRKSCRDKEMNNDNSAINDKPSLLSGYQTNTVPDFLESHQPHSWYILQHRKHSRSHSSSTDIFLLQTRDSSANNLYSYNLLNWVVTWALTDNIPSVYLYKKTSYNVDS